MKLIENAEGLDIEIISGELQDDFSDDDIENALNFYQYFLKYIVIFIIPQQIYILNFLTFL